MTEIVHNTIKKVKRLVEAVRRAKHIAKRRQQQQRVQLWIQERKEVMRDLHQDLLCSIKPRGLESQAQLMTSIIMKMNDYNISSTQMLDHIRPIDPMLAERLIEEGF